MLSTATPTWSIADSMAPPSISVGCRGSAGRVAALPPWRRYCSAGGVGATGVSVDAAARPRWMPGRRSGAVTGVPAMIRSISSRSSTSSARSACGELVELDAVGAQELLGGPERLVGQLADLLVADAAGRLGQHLGVDAQGGEAGPHRVVVDHRVGDVGHAAQVVGGAVGDRAEHQRLGRAAAQQHGHHVDQLGAGAQVAVLGGQVERVAQRPAARDDRDRGGPRRPTAAARRRARGRPRGRPRRAARGR